MPDTRNDYDLTVTMPYTVRMTWQDTTRPILRDIHEVTQDEILAHGKPDVADAETFMLLLPVVIDTGLITEQVQKAMVMGLATRYEELKAALTPEMLDFIRQARIVERRTWRGVARVFAERFPAVGVVPVGTHDGAALCGIAARSKGGDKNDPDGPETPPASPHSG